jgi:hypothetical protein
LERGISVHVFGFHLAEETIRTHMIASHFPKRTRRLWSLFLVLFLVQLVQVRTALGLRVGAIQLRLGRVDGISSVPQGAAFPFTVTARNSGSTDRTVTVTIELDSPSSATQDIRRWTTMVPAGGSRTQEMSEVASQWFAETGTFTLVGKLDGNPNGNVLTSAVTSPSTVVPTFEDVTGTVGLQTHLPHDRRTSRSEGAAWGDVNGDGYPDLYVPLRDQPAQLWIYDPASKTYRQRAGAWDVTNSRGVGVSAAFADFDNDGDEDLYVVNDAIDPVTAEPTGQGNRLYRSERAQGRNQFTDVSDSAGVGTQGNGSSASWGDYDSDSFLDLYVVTSNTHNPPISYYHPDHLFHNDGDGTFTDLTCQSLPANDPASGFCPDPNFGGSTGSGFEAVWFDFDLDGDQDLYLAQDYYEALLHKDINRLYRNDGFDPDTGHWKFTDMCAPPGTRAECRTMNAMGVAVGDYNGDLWPDLAISNTGVKGGNVLLRNARDGTFTEVGAASVVARPDQTATVKALTWGLGFFDFNLDGTEDLYVVAGSLKTFIDQPNQLFVNTPEASFLDLSAPSGAADPAVGRGAAFADQDRDGKIDVYVVNVAGAPILFRNSTPATGHWLEVALTGTASNRDGCGAQVVLTSGALRQARWLVCGSSLGAGNDRMLHFGGVGEGGFVLDIVWPSGTHQTLQGTGVDQSIEVTEGQAGVGG